MPDSEGGELEELEVAPFPLWVLPERLAKFVNEVSIAIACPPDYIAVPMLAVLGTAIGTRCRIQIKEGWCEWPILWTATVGDTGSAKSPAQEKATEPLRRFQDKMREAFETAMQTRCSARNAAAHAPKKTSRPATTVDAEAQDATTVDKGVSSQISAPQLRQVFTTDTTLEALNLCLARNPDGIMLVRDELTAWVLAMNEYKRGSGADRPHWQSMWNGSQIVVNRKGNLMPIIIPRPFVCVVGGLPPAMLGELCDEQGREDGFIHRILFTFPNPVPRVLTDNVIPAEVMERYCEIFDGLRRQRLNILLADPTVTRDLAPDAWVLFRDWGNEHYAEMDSGPTNLRGPWAKLVTYCARISLIIHLARKVCGDSVPDEVDVESVRRAIALINYFKTHTRKVYRHLYASAEEKKITTAVAWLKKQEGRVASLRDFVTYRVAGVTTSEQASALFEKLEETRWGRIERHTPSTGGHQTIKFILECRPDADRLQIIARGRK